MRNLGPFVANSDFIRPDESVRVLGPIVIKGNTHVKSMSALGSISVNGDLITDKVSANGPIQVTGKLVCKSIKVNGPLQVEESLMAIHAKVNGPVTTKGNIEVSESLQLNGTIKANRLFGKNLYLKGEIDVKDGIEATELIKISVGDNTKIETSIIKAPRVEIMANSGNLFYKVFSLITGRKKRVNANSIDIEVIADEFLLNGEKTTKLLK